MNTTSKFFTFLESICDDPSLRFMIKRGYYSCMESIMTNIGDNIWEFDSEDKSLNYSNELSKKYCNVESIIKENDLTDIQPEDIRVGIRGNAMISSGTLIIINELSLVLLIQGIEYNIVNINIPAVLDPNLNASGDDAMLATSVYNLISDLIRLS